MAEGSAAQPVRVLLAIDGLGRGGAERQARLLLTRIPRDRVAARLACFGGDEDELARVAAAGVAVHLLPRAPRRLWPPRVVRELAGIVRRERIRIVQAFLPTFDVLAPLLRLSAPGTRVVTSRRNVDDQLPAARLRWIRRTGRLACAVVANSEAVAESVRRMEPESAAKVRVIPNGIEMPEPVAPEERREARARFGADEGTFLIAYLAHFRGGKGHDRLPDLATRLAAALPACRIAVAGDDRGNQVYRDNAARFRERIARLGLESVVAVLGPIPESRPLLAAADVSLNLSDLEGMSNALLEAMALGLPVVATDAGGAREMIDDGRDGLVVARADLDAALERLIRLGRDPILRQRLGAAARERIARDFSADRMAAAYADLYREIA